MVLDPQQLAVSNPRASIWLLANAGSGKTKVLVDRLLRLLLSGARPESVLCLTYTVSAANEMLLRVQEILAGWLTLDDNDALDRALRDLGEKPDAALRTRARELFLDFAENPTGLRIQTLHSFCQSIISGFPLEVGVVPGSAPIDEDSAVSLKSALLDRLLNERSPEGDAALDYLFAEQPGLFENNDLIMLAEQYLGEHQETLSLDVEDFLEKAPKTFGLDPTSESWDQAFAWQKFDQSLDRAQLVRIAQKLREIPKKVTDVKFFDKLCLLLNQKPDNPSWLENFTELFLTKGGVLSRKLLTKKVLEDDEIAIWLETTIEKTRLLFEQCAAIRCLWTTRHALGLIKKFVLYYQEYKAEHVVLDYDDQIALVHRLFRESGGMDWVRYKLDARIDHLFIDEAQDTSRAQWEILRGLSSDFFAGDKGRPQTLFVVGDPKQSIYRFQGADPKGFSQEKEKYRAIDVLDRRLLRSYRSAQPILDVVDETFRAYQEIAGDDSTFCDSEHESTRDGEAGEVFLAPPLDHAEQNIAVARRWLVQHLARTIKGWIGERRIEALGRCVVSEDILILFINRQGMFAPLAHELRRLDVPVFSGESAELLDSLAVQDIVALLRYMLFHDDDYALACVLKSALIGLGEDELMTLALERGEQSLHQALSARAETPRYAEAAAWLGALRREADFTTVNGLLGSILHRSCPCGASGLQALIGRFGALVQRVLGRLERLAIVHDREQCSGLQGFVDFLWHRHTKDRDRVEGGGAVRIMTIHAAKGLQAPIVVLPETWLTSKKPRTPSLYVSNNLPMLDMGGKVKPQALDEAIGERRAADRAEHWRLLYVAMTRAEYALHLYTAKQEPKKSASAEMPWYGLLDKAMTQVGAKKTIDDWAFAEKSSGGIGFSDAMRCYRSKQSREIIAVVETGISPSETMPEWLSTPVSERVPPSFFTYRVMQDAAQEKSRRRGVILHAVLERLCGKTLASYSDFIATGLRDTLEGETCFTNDDVAAMHSTLERIVANPEIIGILRHAEAEVEIGVPRETGVDLRRLDCLLLTEDCVRVIDFKSGSKPASMPVAYQSQLENYTGMLRQIFPGRCVDAGILWLEEAKFEWLNINQRKS